MKLPVVCDRNENENPLPIWTLLLETRYAGAMIAVDTNVVVRLLVGDDPKQAAAAESLFASQAIWISKTVLLETGWVLRKLYGLDDHALRNVFTKLLGIRTVTVEDEPSVAAALALTVHGVDFADAMHVSSRPPGAVFVSFDRSFVRRARRAGLGEVASVPAVTM